MLKEENNIELAARLNAIQSRRAELQLELEQIENSIGDNIDDIKEGIQEKTDPKHWIRKYPLASLGVAVGVGLLLGAGKGEGNTRGGRGPAVSALLGELKKVLVAKTIATIVSSAEQYFSEPRKK